MFYNAREFSHHIHTTGETIMTQDELKKAVGWAALQYVQPGTIVGVGTGSTAAHFIDALGTMKGGIQFGRFNRKTQKPWHPRVRS